MRVLNRIYAFLGWAIIGLGGLHMLTTFRLSSSPAFRVWFFGSGIALVLVGAINLLHRAYGQSAPGLRAVCRSANIFITLFAAVAGTATRASIAEFVIIVGLLGGATALSFLRSVHVANLKFSSKTQ